eukprot:4460825-Alexandrium_andersonii.AAC.1
MDAWWEAFARDLRSTAQNGMPAVVLIDASARVGSRTSGAVGNYAPETGNGSGQSLHAMME